jgi:hydrogenase maturation protein HypF
VSMIIKISGRVQGVGFRPFVWRLANKYRLNGSVINSAECVLIKVYGNEENINCFVEELKSSPPPSARIENITCQSFVFAAIPDEFVIAASDEHCDDSDSNVEIPPDLALCKTCLLEFMDPDNRRYGFAFTHCTDCGPRFSIIQRMPYDRANTTMADFFMCDACLMEYHDPLNRRFHYQANCCSNCGPQLQLIIQHGVPVAMHDTTALIDCVSALIKAGNIVAFKGVGGFNLMADAHNDEVIARLRERKKRPHKALALMAQDVAIIEKYAYINAEEKMLLCSAGAPIVLLRRKNALLPNSVAPGLNRLGFILPYTALHVLLLQRFDKPLLFTSANRSGEPTYTNNDEVITGLSSIADYFVVHNRDIAQGVDDSVAQLIDNSGVQLIRAGRGWVPSYFKLPESIDAAPDILAMGAQMKSTVAVLHNRRLTLSPPLNDLNDPRTLKIYQKQSAHLLTLYGIKPQIIATDKHPHYQSTVLGRALAEQFHADLYTAQHHHAHLVACLLEHESADEERPVLGLALDGTGMGTDQTLWGAEFFVFDFKHCQRIACFKPVVLPGASQAIRQPWRSAYAYLREVPEWALLLEQNDNTELLSYFSAQQSPLLEQMIAKSINCPLSSSAGRLFDAVAAMLTICRDSVTYEGQAAMALEALAEEASDQHDSVTYPYKIGEWVGMPCIDWNPMWPALLEDLAIGTPRSLIALRFHGSLHKALMEMIYHAQAQYGSSSIALSGGAFQNRRLLSRLVSELRERQLKVFLPRRLPCNDEAISLGQAVIAAANFTAF